jgi:hypothetical protein
MDRAWNVPEIVNYSSVNLFNSTYRTVSDKLKTSLPTVSLYDGEVVATKEPVTIRMEITEGYNAGGLLKREAEVLNSIWRGTVYHQSVN